MMWTTAVFVLLSFSCLQASCQDTVSKLENEYWLWRMKDSPSYSTYMDYYGFNDRLRSYNTSMFESRKDDMEEFLKRLESVDKTNHTPKQKADYDILHDTVKTYLDGYKWRFHAALNPINFLGGIQLYYSLRMARTNTRGDFENYIVRLRLQSQQVDEIIESMRLAIKLGFQYNNVSIETAPGQIKLLLVNNVTESYFYSCCFTTTLDSAINIPEITRNDIRSRGEAAVNDTLDAYRRLRDFLVHEYIPHTREEIGVGTLVNGTDFYRACLRWHLSYDMSPDDVHQTGLNEVNRIYGNMMAIMRRLGFVGTVQEFFKSLQNDTRFVIDDGDEIVRMYEELIKNRINPQLNKFFKNIPDIPIVVRKMTYDGPGGGYSSATENSPGVFSVSVMRPRENPTFEFMALALHEANPGHHLQHIYGMQAELPDYRKQAELSFYDPPFYFPFYSAYAEGWALYSEYLGEEMGLYKDDYEMMGRYSAEMLRSCRLVVDTGMHHLGWSRERAIEYMLNYTAYSRETVEIEINRYITWPGQACAYKLGEIQIKNLRKKAEDSLGTRFDIKDFHLVVLENGGMPMSVLEDIITDWIHTKQNEPQPTSLANTLHRQLQSVPMLLLLVSISLLL